MDAKERLKKYVEEDVVYIKHKQNPDEKLDDFEEYCLQHCLDIKEVLEELEEKDKVIDKKNKCLLEIAKETMEMVKWLESKGMSFDNEDWVKELERMLEEGKNDK